MRYVVTGAAGFIGSHLLRALLERGHDATGWDAFTDYYDPALKEENARGLPVERLDLVEDALDLDGVDGVFHLAGQPGVASFGSVFPIYVRQNVLASQRLFEAAADVGVRVTFASSSSVYGDAAAYPTPEDTAPRPIAPYGITKLACEHLARAYGVEFGLDVVDRSLLHDLRPSPAPGHGARAHRRLSRGGSAVRAPRRRRPVEELHLRRRRRRRDDPRDGGARTRAACSTSAAARRSRCSRRSRRSDGSPDAASSSSRLARRQGDRRGPRPTRRASAPISAGRRAPRSRRGSQLSGAGPLIGSRPDEHRSPAARVRGETGFPPRAPFFSRAWGTSRFPTPLPAPARDRA